MHGWAAKGLARERRKMRKSGRMVIAVSVVESRSCVGKDKGVWSRIDDLAFVSFGGNDTCLHPENFRI